MVFYYVPVGNESARSIQPTTQGSTGARCRYRARGGRAFSAHALAILREHLHG